MNNIETGLFEQDSDGSYENSVRYFRDDRYIHRELCTSSQCYTERVLSHLPNTNEQKDFFVSSLNSRIEPLSPPSKRLTYIDLFCGGGGLSLGVQSAAKFLGYNPKLCLAADIDAVALDLVKKHFKPIYARSKTVEDLIQFEVDYTGTINKFISDPIILDTQIAALKGRIDLLVGGPPCQGHSNLNNSTRRFDPRNLLYMIMPAFAVALDIPNIIIENVQTITNARENVVGLTKSLLHQHGYSIEECKLLASNFGVAQSRIRHFLIASKTRNLTSMSLINRFKTDEISFGEACTNMPKLESRLSNIEVISNISQENIERIDYLHDNNVDDLPNFVRPDCHKNGHTYRAVYGRIKADLPMTTVTTGFASPGRGRYTHPTERRPISIREAGRVQAFPDWYWEPTIDLGWKKANYQKVIGDAVPSQFAYPLMANLFA